MSLSDKRKCCLEKNETPWLDWLIQHEGQVEWTGKKPSEFVSYCFSKTTFGPLRGVTPPSCASTLCASLEDSGYKSTKSAAAKSYMKFGDPCELKPGAILVFSFVEGHFHVTCCRRVVSDTLVDAIGGNQGHLLQTCTYNRKYLKAIRWPKDKL